MKISERDLLVGVIRGSEARILNEIYHLKKEIEKLMTELEAVRELLEEHEATANTFAS